MIVTESIELETPRLTLGQWRDEDLPVFAELNADPEIMRYFPSCLSREDSDAMAARCKALIADNGWGFWAVRLRDSGAFIGFVGLNRPIVELPFSPCVEIGWRLHSAYWGKGYATEAARRALAFAFTDLALDEVVSFTATSNTPSQAVMQRLGMRNSGRNFLHPAVPASHPLEEHVLFTLGADEWFASQH
ncbi:GNAT family N-acetyltransferase [uncultured Spongiibacter sp.]|uniref:GNAT family N-acetyltransferase n=1 Tax=uncultured Spongiibacter sp. TaxID=870896 RepID=UPI0025972C69|nr:GNAT family N-acetyltransferase [uncultured Spongiibacter sp.]